MTIFQKTLIERGLEHVFQSEKDSEYSVFW
jgi:hypothetical protein